MNFQYTNAESNIIIHESFDALTDAINMGMDLERIISKDPAVKTHTQMILEDLASLGDMKRKTMLFKHGFENSRIKRNFLTPLISEITGLASKRTTEQISKMLSKLDLSLQKNQFLSQVVENNQESLINSINQSMSAINNLESKVLNTLKANKATAYAIAATNHFRKYTQKILKHYESIMRIPENKLEIFNIVNSSKLAEIESALGRHAEISRSIPGKTSLISLFKEAYLEILVTSDNHLLITFLIPLVEDNIYHIKFFHGEQLILQTQADSELFTIVSIDQVERIRGNSITLTNRPILHIRQYDNWNMDIGFALQTKLIHDVMLITNVTLGPTSIICPNGSHTHNQHKNFSLAITIPHECSLTSSILKIKSTQFKATVNIKQDLQIQRIYTKAVNTQSLPNLHKKLTLMNLTKIPRDIPIIVTDTKSGILTTDWLFIIGISLFFSVLPWLFIFAYGFIKKSKKTSEPNRDPC